MSVSLDKRFIPDIWVEHIRRDLNSELVWNAKYPAARLPIPPCRVRYSRAFKRLIERRREWLALKIAPWLEPDDWYR